MQRYKITVEYDGTGLAGWQVQAEQYSVQEAIEAAIFNLTSEKIGTICAGRTDAGVHAYGQVAHFDLAKEWDSFRLSEGINFYLRKDENLPIPMQIAVVGVEKMPENFNARFDAKKRHYEYKMVNRRGHLALNQQRAWCVHENIDVAKMQDAAQILVGVHDFTSFRSTECQSKNPVKSIDEIRIERSGEDIVFYINARSFLHHQVRNIVGSLKYVGTGKWQKSDLQNALNAKDRRAAGPTAPAYGLYFAKVEY